MPNLSCTPVSSPGNGLDFTLTRAHTKHSVGWKLCKSMSRLAEDFLPQSWQRKGLHHAVCCRLCCLWAGLPSCNIPISSWHAAGTVRKLAYARTAGQGQAIKNLTRLSACWRTCLPRRQTADQQTPRGAALQGLQRLQAPHRQSGWRLMAERPACACQQPGPPPCRGLAKLVTCPA